MSRSCRRWLLRGSYSFCFLLLAMIPTVRAQDLLLQGGTLVDGTGSPPRPADVLIRDGRIVAVGANLDAAASDIINIGGLVVAPGFIDLHSHAEAGLSDPYLSAARNNVTQGITTVVVGQDGLHGWPLGSSLTEQTALWRRQGVGTNVVPLAGQGIARIESIGPSREEATAEQAAKVGARVESVLAEGAWGISTGLGYFPGRNSSTEEIIAATRPVAHVDGFYITHLRDQGDGLLESIDEAIRICREAGVRCVITHIKTAGARNWGKADEAIARIKAARAEGVPVYADLYPYRVSDNGIDFTPVPLRFVFSREDVATLFSPVELTPDAAVRWSYRVDPALHSRYRLETLVKQPWPLVAELIGASDRVRRERAYRYAIRECLEDESRTAALLERVDAHIGGTEGAAHIQITRHPDPALVGLPLADAASQRGASAARTAVDLTLEGAAFTSFQMAEEDIVSFTREPFVAVGTDGRVPEYGFGTVHPRSYGTFTRRLRRYVFDRKVIDLAEAIRTSTGLPAEIVGLEDRGLVREGFWADLVVLDPDDVRDRASYSEPHRYSEGIEWVIVNGEIVVGEGKPTGRKAGRVLLKTEL